jgi:glycogen debranching enzyme
VKELENQARAALRWVDQFGDRDQDGYVEYKRRNVDTGIENQCWKDSGNSIQFRRTEGALQPRFLDCRQAILCISPRRQETESRLADI